MLCDSALSASIVYEDAEDGQIDGWTIYDSTPANALVSAVPDIAVGSTVIELVGDGRSNGFRFGGTSPNNGGWNDDTRFFISWRMRASEAFTIYVAVRTTDGFRYLAYNDLPYDRGAVGARHLYHGLGPASSSDAWVTISRDLSADLENLDPGNTLLSVQGFLVRGSMRLDDIVLDDSAPTSNTPPQADAGPDLSTILGQSVSLDGSASSDPDGSITGYEWTLEDGTSIGTATSVSWTPTTAGSRTVTLTVTDDRGGSSSDSALVDVADASPAGPEISVDSLTAGSTVAGLTSITGTATDGSNVDTVELVLENLTTGQFWDGANYYPAFRPEYTAIRAELTGPNDARTWSHDFDFAIDGDYRLTVLAVDGDGNATDPAPSIDFTIASSQPSGDAPNLSRYRMVFRDEFNGSALDPGKWRTSYYWGPYQPINAERQLYVDTLGINAGFEHDPFELSGGKLRIRATPVGGAMQPPEQPAADDPIWSTGRDGFRPDFGYRSEYDPSTVQYLSGAITSIDRFDSAYGYFEARMKVPAGRGLWPAFWLLTTKYVEDVPEIDIMENLGQRPDRMQHMYHYFEPRNNWRKISTPEAPSLNADLSKGFHTYGVAWEPGQIVWYIDGIERRRVTDADYKISRQAMYLLANLAVGGWPGDPDSPDTTGVSPATLEIDYIRAYERTPPALITPAVLRNDFQLVFSDNFDGGAPNASRWRTSYPWGPFFPIAGENGVLDEEQYYVDWRGIDSNMTQQPFGNDGGTLSITAEPISSGNLPPHPSLNDPLWTDQAYRTYQRSSAYADGLWVPGYTSGVITSREAFSFVNGYVEIRAKLPEGSGLWPALRLINSYYVGPTPEIDIATIRGDAPGALHHAHSYSDGIGRVKFEETTTGAGGQSYADGFHDYGVEWRRGVIKWYVDGEVVATLEDANVSGQLMYVEANLGVGGDFVGPVDPTIFPASLEIDHVKVYQLKDIE